MLQLSMACPAGNGMARMIPVDFVHAPAGPKPAIQADAQERQNCAQLCRERALPNVAAQRVAALRQALDHEGQATRSLWSVVDGGYTNRTFIKQRPARTVLVGRIRSDAKLYYLPETSHAQTGRHRVYGLRAPTPEQLRQDLAIPWMQVQAFAAGKTHTFKIKTLAPLRWRAAGQAHNLRVIVIAPLAYKLTCNGRCFYRKPAYLICTDPDASLQQVLQAYLWRWDIEVNFRDEKTLLGIGQAQVRGAQAVEKVPALAVAAYAMLTTAATQEFGPTGKPDQLPAPKWQRKKNSRASTQSLINHLRSEVWARAIRFSSFVSHTSLHTKPQKLDPCLEGAIFYAAG